MDRVNHCLLSQYILGLAGVLFLLVGCTGSSELTPSLAGEATSTLITEPSPNSTLKPTDLPTPALRPSPQSTSMPAPNDATTPTTVRATATPTSCLGWMCTVKGTVYVNDARQGNELPGARVKLSHFSNCSPTRGKRETVTGQDGTFVFEAYLHDTDTFRFEVEEKGYQPVRLQIGGFDCLFCSCSPVEIVLEP